MTQIPGIRALGARARATRAVVSGAVLLLGGACTLDVANPNAANEQDVLGTPAGLRALTIGMQGRFGNAIEEAVWIPGLVAGEIGATNLSQAPQRAFQRFPDEAVNSIIEEENIELLDLWAKQYAVVRTADEILLNVEGVGLDPGTRSGMTALARTLKAVAFGTLIESFEQIPIETTEADPPFAPRDQVLARVLELLAAARADLAAQEPSAEFNTSLLAPGFDLLNTTRAMQARFALAAGQYEQALAFANEVPAGATSVLTYTAIDPNPLRNVIHVLGYFDALAAFRTNAEAGDARVNRFTTATLTPSFGGTTLADISVYPVEVSPIPVFTQDELTLIRAEAHARLGRLGEARDAVNAVRQAAGLPARGAAALPTQEAVLDEIFRQRTYSLFLTGLHWGDQRRFGRIADAKVEWLPYPQAELCANPNAPPGCG